MSETHIRPRRSILYMPGANERALVKAKSLNADGIILDLEDAVAPEAKNEARDRVAAAVASGGYGAREVVVRINSLDTPWGEADLKAAVKATPHVILAPKVNNAADVAALSAKIDDVGGGDDLVLWVMIETPLAILNIREIAAAAVSTRLSGFVMGTNDLAKDLRATMAPGRDAFLNALSISLTAARAYELVAIDGVYNDLKNEEGFEAECRQGQTLGFDGKTLIHPGQLDVCNRVFSPTEEEIEHSRAIIDAFAAPENAGQGVIKVNGKMTEILHLENAKRIVSVAEAISASVSTQG